jgi:hypothetical protein
MKRNTSNKMLLSNKLQNHSYIKLFAVCGLLLIFSCKAKKQLVTRVAVATPPAQPAVVKVNPIIAKLAAIRNQQVFFNNLTAKAKATLNMDGASNDVTLNIRINRDKEIWVSVTAILGVEVARLVVTPDSLLLVNRLEGLYLKQPFSYIHSFAGNQVNYKMLESLLVGNAINEFLNEKDSLKIDAGNTTLSGNLQDLVFRMIFGPDMKVNQTNLNNETAAQSLQVVNGTFIQVTNKVIPSQINMVSTVKDKKIELSLHYTKMDFDKVQDYPFSINPKYKEQK